MKVMNVCLYNTLSMCKDVLNHFILILNTADASQTGKCNLSPNTK